MSLSFAESSIEDIHFTDHERARLTFYRMVFAAERRERGNQYLEQELTAKWTTDDLIRQLDAQAREKVIV